MCTRIRSRHSANQTGDWRLEPPHWVCWMRLPNIKRNIVFANVARSVRSHDDTAPHTLRSGIQCAVPPPILMHVGMGVRIRTSRATNPTHNNERARVIAAQNPVPPVGVPFIHNDILTSLSQSGITVNETCVYSSAART